MPRPRGSMQHAKALPTLLSRSRGMTCRQHGRRVLSQGEELWELLVAEQHAVMEARHGGQRRDQASGSQAREARAWQGIARHHARPLQQWAIMHLGHNEGLVSITAWGRSIVLGGTCCHNAIGQFHDLMRSVDGMGSAATAID